MSAPDSLADTDLQAIQEGLRPLDELRQGLGERVREYVFDGVGESVLEELFVTDGAFLALGLESFYRRETTSQANSAGRFSVIFEDPSRLPPSTLLRLAKVLASSLQPSASLNVGSRKSPFWTYSWLGTTSRPGWDEVLIRLCFRKPMPDPLRTRWENRLPAKLFENLLELDGQSSAMPYQRVLDMPRFPGASDLAARYLFGSLAGFADRLADRGDLVRQALDHEKPAARIFALALFHDLGLSPTPFIDTLAKLAVGTALTVREPAGRLLLEAGPAALAPLIPLAEAGPSWQREQANRLIGRLGTPEALAFLQGRGPVEKSASLRKLLAELTANSSAGMHSETPCPSPTATDSFIDIDLDEETRLAVLAWLRGRFESAAEGLLERLVEREAWSNAPFLSTSVPSEAGDGALDALLRRPTLRPLHLVRLLRIAGLLGPDDIRSNLTDLDPRVPRGWLDRLISAYRESHTPPMTYRVLASAFLGSGLDPDLLIKMRFKRFEEPMLVWENEAIWPYFAERISWLGDRLGQCVSPDDRMAIYLGDEVGQARALEIIGLFPELPHQLRPRIEEIALGSAKENRRTAQRLLEKRPETLDLVLEALAGKAANSRTAAADWLGSWRPSGAAEALQRAFAAERVPAARTAIAKALAAMGETRVSARTAAPKRADVRLAILEQAGRGLKKSLPDKLAWFPFNRLPALRWQDNGEAVQPTICDWIVVSAWKSKTAEPSIDLVDLMALLRPDDRRRLGQCVFSVWLVEDLNPLPADARREQLKALLGIFGVGTIDDLLRAHPEMAEAIERLKEAPGKGNVANKGLLAVVAAAGPVEVVEPIRDYINKWYGYRAWQCRALVTVLAWIDSPEAIAFLLDVAKRFRTATIRKEAEVQARKLADRKRMTLAELSDVSIPDAGLDAAGRVVLDFGPRRFIARLDDDAELLLEDEDGKVLKALPSPAKSDDAELVAAAKSRLTALKKEVKAVRKRVIDRLQEALCTQRSWTCSGWQRSLLGHPIAGRLCRRVVWTASSSDGPPITFRPLEDGSLTDLDDNSVHPPADASVRIAHRLTIGDTPSDRWSGHLSDYEVTPLLPQALVTAFRLPEELLGKTAWAFRAESPVALATFGRRARGLGYDPGAFRLQDGGDRFHRYFPSVSLCATIELVDLEEGDKVSELNLSFLRAAEGLDARAGKRIALEEVPEVLLSECVADISRISGAAPIAAEDQPAA